MSNMVQCRFSVVCIPSGTPLTVKDLITACKSVTDWHTLDIQLGLTTSQLDDLHITYHAYGADRLKAEMFKVWLKSSPEAAARADLITALKAMDEDRVVGNVRAAYSPTAPCMMVHVEHTVYIHCRL